jgi:hypothetical protein
MTAKADLPLVSNLSTFGQWKDLTNDLRGVAQISVTMGDNEVNNGNVVLNGDLTLSAAKIFKADTLKPTDNVNFLLLDKNDIRVKGESAKVFVNSLQDSSTNDTAATLQFSKGDSYTETFFVKTNADHTELEIGSATKSFKINGSTGVITSSNGAKVSSSMIADALNGIDLGQTTAGLGKFTKLECTGTGGHGVIDNVAIGTNTASTIKGTQINIDPEINGDSLSTEQINALRGDINNTRIGQSLPQSASFTSVTTTNGVTGSNGVLGYGDVGDSNGDIIVDVDNATFNGTATQVNPNAVRTVLETIYSVGSIYITTDNRSPDAIMNWPSSNWERYGQGKTLLGWDTGKAMVSLTYQNSTNDYKIVLPNSSHGIKETDTLEINKHSGQNIQQHNIIIADGHQATVKSVAGAEIVVALNGNPVPSGGTSFTIPSNSYVIHKGFGTVGNLGGEVSTVLTTSQIPDHVHDNKAWHGEQFYLYNDANSPTSLQGTSRAQGPQGSRDAHLYQYSGGVHGYEDSSGVHQVDVGKPHQNCMPFITTYMWKRIAD